nr:hypothetical protein [Serratia entomophila]
MVESKGSQIPLVETPFFDKYADSLAGVVVIENRNSDAFEQDLKLLTSQNLTLEEVKSSDKFNVMQKARLNKVYKGIYDQLDEIYTLS